MTLIGGYSLAFLDGLIGMFIYFYKLYEDIQAYDLTLTVMVIMVFMFTFGITLGSSAWPYASYMMPSGGIIAAQVLSFLLAGVSIISFSVVVNA